MKRLTLLIVLLAALGLASGFALEVKPALALAGSATLTWGIDLDDQDTGFLNSASADFTIYLVADGQSDTHAGKGPVYGSITISDLELYWIDGVLYAGADVVKVGYDWLTNDGETVIGAEPSVSAKLVIAPFELSIYGAPAMNSEGAPAIEVEDATGNATVDAIIEAEPAFTFGAYNTNQGTSLKWNVDENIWVQADLVSHDSYDVTPTQSEYAVGAEGSVKFAPITVGLGLFQGINYTPANPLGGYLTVQGDVTGIGTAKAGFDWQYDFSPAAFTWDVFASAQMNFNKDATAYLLAKVYYNPAGTNLDSAVVLMIPVDTVLGAVNADLTFYALDLSTAAEIAALGHLGYSFKLPNGMKLGPAIEVAYTMQADVSVLNISPEAVLTISEGPDTTLTLAYTSGDLLADPIGKGAITLALGVTY